MHSPARTAAASPTTGSVRADVALAAGVAVLQVAGTLAAAHHHSPHRPLDALGVVLLLAPALALVVRRRAPVATFGAVFATTLAYVTIGYPHGPVFLALVVAFANLVWRGHRAEATIGVVAGWVAFLWLPDLAGTEPAPSTGAMLGLAAWLLVLLAGAELVGARRQRAIEAKLRADEARRRRTSEERLRIARDLHDVLAHNIALINVRAGVALHLEPDLPDSARDALVAIKDASSEALNGLRWALDALRQGEDATLAPPPGRLAELDVLVRRASTPTLDVRCITEGAPRPVGIGVETAAYRVVQEALTNVTKHAGAREAVVRVVFDDDRLIVQVDDDGAAGGAVNRGPRRGLTGMRERVEALGGTLAAGPRPERGFRVRAELPLSHAEQPA